MNERKIDTKVMWIIILGALFFVSLMMLFVFPLGMDWRFHLYRVGAMAFELDKNPWQLPVRMLSDSLSGYGYGAALYYGDFFFYIPAFLVCLGIDEVWAYKMFLAIILWGTFFLAYMAIRIWGKKRETAVLFAVFYAFSAYGMQNLFIRHAIGESLAFAFLPLVIATFYNILYDNNKKWNWILLGVSMSAIAVSHLLTLVITVVVLGVWSVIQVKKMLVERKFIEILKAAILAVGLSASFLFPLLEQMLYQKTNTPTGTENEKYVFTHHTLEIIDYFVPYEIKKMLATNFENSWVIEHWHPGAIGLFVLLLIVSVLVFRPKCNKKQIALLLGAVGGLYALSVYRFTDILSKFMISLQFPWRILGIITLAFSFVGSGMVENVGDERRKKAEWLLVLGTFVIAVWTVGPWCTCWDDIQRKIYFRENEWEISREELFRYDKSGADGLYLPAEVEEGYELSRGEIIVSNRAGVKFDWHREFNDIVVQIKENPHTDGVLEMPLYMYKGYAAKDENGVYLNITKSKNGLVNVEIADTLGEIKVWYRGTLIQRISDIITVLTILVIVFLCGRNTYKSRANREVLE